jgi:ribosomal protection tetracycline resistance protein
VKTLNLGVVAHVDAGKTSLTERLLHAAGVIDEIGSVDDGSTQTDTLDLERQRGITIKSAVVSFVVDDVTVNLVDTPGHSDFVAEVERVLGILDGAVLVVSAVEGVQSQTRVLMRALQRLGIPTLVFVNKIDRTGAAYDAVLDDLARRLTPAVVAMGDVTGLGTRDAAFRPYDVDDDAFTRRLVDRLTEHDDAFLAACADDAVPVSPARVRHELAVQTALATVHPVFFGSAMTGAGIDAVVSGIVRLLPGTSGDPDAPLSGTVFKVERGPAGERVAFVRLHSGTLRVRDRVRVGGAAAGTGTEKGAGETVTAVQVFDHGAVVRRPSVSAGRIARVLGLGAVRIGDVVGAPHAQPADVHSFPPPTLETVVDAKDPRQRGAMFAALTQLAEQDPLIGLRQDAVRGEVSVSLFGEVQKEVLEATLAAEHGVRVAFRETTTLCVERLVGSGAAHELIAVEPNPFLATVGLSVAPAPVGTGVDLRLGVERGSMPPAFFTAVEETVRGTLQQGLHGWPVLDCVVTMTHAGYWARQSHAHGTFDASMSSTAGDFRHLTPLVLMAALTRAGTEVLEPIHRFELEIPQDVLGATLSALARLHAVPLRTDPVGSSYLLSGDLPAAWVHRLQQEVPTLTRGEGVLSSEFDHHAPVRGSTPSRPRTDLNPLRRKEYLTRLERGE